MEGIFFNSFDLNTRKMFFEDKEKFLVYSWIIFNTNYSSQEYLGLEENQCYFSYSTLELELNLSHKKLLRIIKELINDGFINFEFKSNSKHKKSILNLLKNTPNKCTKKGTGKSTSKGTSKNGLNTSFEDDKEPVKEPVKGLSSKNIYKNNNIYSSSAEEIWSLYPLKQGKANAIKKIPKLLKQYGKEQIIRCIDRYIQYVDNQRKNGFSELKYKNGSTFFNTGYVDYLDCNFMELGPKQKKIKKESNFDY
ncbi:hypothetical protein [Clostridium perfringens]|uniref:hypothetical protein n=1 Tax=Clostridium perfringens TaxID=1502 RepID=UPI0039ECDB65